MNLIPRSAAEHKLSCFIEVAGLMELCFALTDHLAIGIPAVAEDWIGVATGALLTIVIPARIRPAHAITVIVNILNGELFIVALVATALILGDKDRAYIGVAAARTLQLSIFLVRKG